MKNFTFQVIPEVLGLGVKIQTARISNLKNTKSTDELDKYINSELQKIRASWHGKIYKDDPILVGFRELHTKVGRSNRDYHASPEVLLSLLLERDRFPRINSIVDIYNLISLKTRLALGAHDINFVQGNITLKFTRGNEKFLPLGAHNFVSVPAGEYAYIDDRKNIICRMEVMQVEPTKITLNSSDIFLIIQGNQNTDAEYVRQTAEEVCQLISKYCGGEYRILH